MEINFEGLVGKRILVNIFPHGTCDNQFTEYNILEISPVGKFIKLENATNGNQCWKNVNDVDVVEILK